MADFKRKDVQKVALQLVDMIGVMRAEMAAQDATIQRQTAEIDRLRAAVSESVKRNVTLFGDLQTAVEEINRLRSAVVLCPRCVEIEAQTSAS